MSLLFKIEEQAKEVEELKSLLLAERHQQELDFKMLEKEMQEQLRVESIVLQAQLKSDVKQSVYVRITRFAFSFLIELLRKCKKKK